MKQKLELYNEVVPLWHQGRLVFGTAAAPVFSPNPIPLDISQTEMMQETVSRQCIPELKSEILLEAARDKKFFSLSESLILKFSNSIQMRLEPAGSFFLDMAFHLKDMNILFRP